MIYQILPTISYGDAVSNDAISIREMLMRHGYESKIYAENIGKNVSAEYVKNLPQINKKDIIIYHKSTGTGLTEAISKMKCFKIMRYHNITPKEYFAGYNIRSYELVKNGRESLEIYSKYYDCFWPVSNYNATELKEIGCHNISVIPILVRYADYDKEPSKNIINTYSDGKHNLVFVGRIVPNKRQEDLIKIFYFYNKYFNPDSRLILVGSYEGMEKYYRQLIIYSEELGLKSNIVFTGHVSFKEILAYYKIADTFISTSEHEGFGVPLVESMYFKKPIIAYDSSAISETLGSSGILIKKKNYIIISEVIEELRLNEVFRKRIIENQTLNLERFNNLLIEEMMVKQINRYLGSKK